MKRIGTKSGKRNISGQNSRGCIGTEIGLYRYTPQQKPNDTGTDPSCTGTAQQNAIDTGTDQSYIGTGVPKMPRLL